MRMFLIAITCLISMSCVITKGTIIYKYSYDELITKTIEHEDIYKNVPTWKWGYDWSNEDFRWHWENERVKDYRSFKEVKKTIPERFEIVIRCSKSKNEQKFYCDKSLFVELKIGELFDNDIYKLPTEYPVHVEILRVWRESY